MIDTNKKERHMKDKISPPYYAVIFSSIRTDTDEGYAQTAQHMEALAEKQPGYLGFETIGSGGKSISISYWDTLDNIAAWKNLPDHVAAQKSGQEKWYKNYIVRIAKVEKEYSFGMEYP